MNGREFLDCAVRLSRSGNKSDLRSAVSRAYYGAFHAVRDLFGDSGIRFSANTTEAHAKMPQCLENSNVPDMQLMGRKLAMLRESRNTADYSMSNPRFESDHNVLLQIGAAQEILDTMDRAMEQSDTKENVRRILRNCARSLGLYVV